MGNKTGITLEEALKMLEVANSIIQSQQKEITDQQIKIDAQKVLIQKKEEELSKTQTELTPTIVNTLIKRIDLHNPEIIEGHKKVKVDISFTAAGLISIPDEKELLHLMNEIRNEKSA